MDDRNLDALLTETINQFNYSSNLFDSLESKSNTLVVSISIILAIALNSYFLKKVESVNIIFNLLYYLGLVFVTIPFIFLLNIKQRKFSLTDLEWLKHEARNSPESDLYKIIINTYISIIHKNIQNYESKKGDLRFALILMQLGFFILASVIAYIFISNLI